VIAIPRLANIVDSKERLNLTKKIKFTKGASESVLYPIFKGEIPTDVHSGDEEEIHQLALPEFPGDFRARDEVKADAVKKALAGYGEDDDVEYDLTLRNNVGKIMGGSSEGTIYHVLNPAFCAL
jgi:hypothetical protein